ESASGLSVKPQRPGSPRLGSSTLTTSAPNHASASVQDGPASNWVKSSTLIPARAAAGAEPAEAAAVWAVFSNMAFTPRISCGRARLSLRAKRSNPEGPSAVLDCFVGATRLLAMTGLPIHPH